MSGRVPPETERMTHPHPGSDPSMTRRRARALYSTPLSVTKGFVIGNKIFHGLRPPGGKTRGEKKRGHFPAHPVSAAEATVKTGESFQGSRRPPHSRV